jgi:hypothetical protein
MIVFGLLTICNVRNLNKNHQANVHYRPSERQLTGMLIVQVLSHIILSLPFATVFFMTRIPIAFTSTIMFYFLFTVSKIPFYIDFINP